MLPGSLRKKLKPDADAGRTTAHRSQYFSDSGIRMSKASESVVAILASRVLPIEICWYRLR
jgi:hypothetical protein